MKVKHPPRPRVKIFKVLQYGVDDSYDWPLFSRPLRELVWSVEKLGNASTKDIAAAMGFTGSLRSLAGMLRWKVVHGGLSKDGELWAKGSGWRLFENELRMSLKTKVNRFETAKEQAREKEFWPLLWLSDWFVYLVRERGIYISASAVRRTTPALGQAWRAFHAALRPLAFYASPRFPTEFELRGVLSGCLPANTETQKSNS